MQGISAIHRKNALFFTSLNTSHYWVLLYVYKEHAIQDLSTDSTFNNLEVDINFRIQHEV